LRQTSAPLSNLFWRHWLMLWPTFERDDFARWIHDRWIGRDRSSYRIRRVVHVDDHDLRRFADLLADADKLVRLHCQRAEPDVGRIDAEVLQLDITNGGRRVTTRSESEKWESCPKFCRSLGQPTTQEKAAKTFRDRLRRKSGAIFGNSVHVDKLRHPRSVAYSVELVLLKPQISGGGAYLDCYSIFRQ